MTRSWTRLSRARPKKPSTSPRTNQRKGNPPGPPRPARRMVAQGSLRYDRRHGKAPSTAATRLLREKGVAYTEHLYRYEEKGGTAVSSVSSGWRSTRW